MAGPVATLIVQLQDTVIRTVSLSMAVLTIGRAPENALVLASQQVSRKHAELRLSAHGAFVTDLGSSNGTFVSGERLLPNQPIQLADATSISIGPFTLTYRAPAAAASAAVSEAAGERLISTVSSSGEGGPTGSGVVSPVPQPPTHMPPGGVVAQAHLAPAFAEAAGVAAPTKTNDSHGHLPEPPLDATPPGWDAGWPIPDPDGRCSRYVYDLPIIFHGDRFAGQFLKIFEALWEPLEQRQDHLPLYFDARTCPPSFLPWLASWLGVTFNPRWPEARRRTLLAEIMELYRWRGTRYGLTRIIEICTGITPEISESSSQTNGDQPFVFHVRLNVPIGTEVDRSLIEELIRAHKPAHVGYVLE